MACPTVDVSNHRCPISLLRIGLISVALISSVTLADELSYEDGSTNEWTVIDDDPSGATANIVTDTALSSDVIELAGAGRSNSFRLGGTRASNGGWDDTTRKQLSLTMRTSEAYTLYVAVQTQGGFRYLIYEPRDDDRGLIGSNYIYNGVGTATVSGDWITITRDLAADLQAGEPGNVLLSVQGLVVRGNIRIDDVALSSSDGPTSNDGGGTNAAPVAEAGANQAIDLGAAVTLDASGSSDPDGNVVSWEWRDDQDAVIGNTESVVWTPTSAGALNASLTVTDDGGATASDTLVVTVTDPSGTAGSTVVYEDGSANEWTVIDNDPPGATSSIVTDTDLSSDVIELAGAGRSNSYRLGGTRASNGGWQDSTRDQLSLKMRTSEAYTLYVAVQTQGGFRYLIYEPRDEDRGLIGSSYIYNGVGTATVSGNWVTITRDLATDLQAGEPGNVLLSVQGLVVRGNIRIDDVTLSSGSGSGGGSSPNTAPVAEAGADQAIDLGATVTLDASGSSDPDGNVVGWEWRDDQNAVISTTESVVWTPTTAGALTASLTVTDDGGATASDTLVVTVTDAGAANTAPVAEAGANQTIELSQSVTLDASGSSDPGGTVVGWQWRDDQNAVIGTTESVVWTPTTAGALNASLTVTDDGGATASDTLVVTVTDPRGPSGSTIVYEDGFTNEWTVIDNDPPGATSSIVTDTDLSSNVIELAGAGRSNSYRLGGTRASNGGWQDSTRDQLSLKMRTSEAYTLYVAVQTQGGFRYLIYEPRDDDRGLIGSSYIYNGVGTATVSGNWVTITRDLAADLQAGEPGNVLQSVQGLVVRGNIRLDDVALSSGSVGSGGGGNPNTAPVAEAGADQAIDLGATVTLDASGSSDPDGNVVGWEWRDDQNAVISTTESVAWTPTTAGALTASLTVTDDGGATASDTLVVTVTDAGAANTAPVAEAGANQTIELSQSVTLDASGSSDPGGTVVGWQWRDDQNAVIGTTESVVWTPTTAGALTVSVTVTDDNGATASDTLVVTVTDDSEPADSRNFGVDRSANIGATIVAGSQAHLSGLPITTTHWIGGDDSSLVPELRALLPTLQPGDAVIVRDGSYELKSDVLRWPTTVSGNASAPIFLLAETVGGVQISGNLEWRLKGLYLHVAGFRFVNTTQRLLLEGDHARFTNNTFDQAENALGILASYVEIDNNIWSGSLGQSLWHGQAHIGCNSDCPTYRYNRIHHNTWHDIAKTKSNGLEPIMLGYGYAPLPPGYDNATHARIDHNLFLNVPGDDEVISVKSDSNTIEHNCIVDSGKGALVVRMGSGNRLRHNEVLGARNTPIRISGESNIVENNVFETDNSLVAGVALHSSEKKDSTDVYYRYLAAKDNTITDNRFIGYQFSARDYPAAGLLIEASSNNAIEQNRFEATAGMEPGVRADRHRSVEEFLRDNRITDNVANGNLPAPDSVCLQ